MWHKFLRCIAHYMKILTEKNYYTMSNSKLLAALLGGAAAGAVVGLLMAPQSGPETRKKLLQLKDRTATNIDDLVEEGKRTWYETKGKAKMGAGIAAEELDEFMRHILKSGQRMWKKARNQAEDVADDLRNEGNEAMNAGRRAAGRAANEGRDVANTLKERLS